MILQIKEWNCDICGEIMTDLLAKNRVSKNHRACALRKYSRERSARIKIARQDRFCLGAKHGM